VRLAGVVRRLGVNHQEGPELCVLGMDDWPAPALLVLLRREEHTAAAVGIAAFAEEGDQPLTIGSKEPSPRFV
jgi:hypothetical protein